MVERIRSRGMFMGEKVLTTLRMVLDVDPQQRMDGRLAVDGGEDGRFGEDGILRRLMIRITE